MDVAMIIGGYCSAPLPTYELTKNCCICNKDLSDTLDKDDITYGPDFYIPYHDLAGCVCAPHRYNRVDLCEVEGLWESGYCGKMCCTEEACIGAFRGKKKKEAEKCIPCYALVNLDPDFAVMTSEDEDDVM